MNTRESVKKLLGTMRVPYDGLRRAVRNEGVFIYYYVGDYRTQLFVRADDPREEVETTLETIKNEQLKEEA